MTYFGILFCSRKRKNCRKKQEKNSGEWNLSLHQIVFREVEVWSYALQMLHTKLVGTILYEAEKYRSATGFAFQEIK